MTRIQEENDKLIVKNGFDWAYVHAGYTVDFEFKDYDENDVQITVTDSDNKLTAIIWIENSAAKELVAYCEENNINHKVTY